MKKLILLGLLFCSVAGAQTITNTNAVLYSAGGISNNVKAWMNNTQFNNAAIPLTLTNVYPALLSTTNIPPTTNNALLSVSASNQFYWDTNIFTTNLTVVRPGPATNIFTTNTLIFINGLLRGIQ